MSEHPAAPHARRAPRIGWADVSLALASLLAFAFGMIAAEWAARRLDPSYLISTRGIHVFSADYGWKGRPNAVAPMGSGRVTLNERGFRGRVLPLPKPANTRRVLVLGDSIAFGFGVADDQTFVHLLDVRENGLESMSLATQGWGPGQSLLALEHEGMAAKPDVVILALCLRNDFADAVLPVALYNGVTPRPRFLLGADGRLSLDASAMRRSRVEAATQWLGDNSHLFNRVFSLLRPQPVESGAIWRDRKKQALSDEMAALDLVVALVLEMRRQLFARGIEFVVATFPSGLSLDAEPPLHRGLHKRLEEEAVRLMVFRSLFGDLGLATEAIVLDSTGHLSPKGHLVVAEQLERELARESRRTRGL